MVSPDDPWPKVSCSFGTLRSYWGDWPRHFFQHTLPGDRHPWYFDSSYNDGICPFPQLTTTGPVLGPRHLQSVTVHLQARDLGFSKLPDSRSWRFRYMFRILSVLHVICSLHHPSSVKCSQGCPHDYPLGLCELRVSGFLLMYVTYRHMWTVRIHSNDWQPMQTRRPCMLSIVPVSLYSLTPSWGKWWVWGCWYTKIFFPRFFSFFFSQKTWKNMI